MESLGTELVLHEPGANGLRSRSRYGVLHRGQFSRWQYGDEDLLVVEDDSSAPAAGAHFSSGCELNGPTCGASHDTHDDFYPILPEEAGPTDPLWPAGRLACVVVERLLSETRFVTSEELAGTSVTGVPAYEIQVE